MIPFDTTQGQLIAILLAWSLVWLTAAFAGLYANPREVWKHFWFMSGLWVAIDAAIVYYGLVTAPLPDAELVPILRINSGLDILYIAVGILLATRTTPRLKGFGYGVLVQGLFLLILDVTFWLRAA